MVMVFLFKNTFETNRKIYSYLLYELGMGHDKHVGVLNHLT